MLGVNYYQTLTTSQEIKWQQESLTEADLKAGCGCTPGNCNTYLEVDFKYRFELDVTVPFRNASMEIQGGVSVPSIHTYLIWPEQ